ncbi:MAG: hypothetical protein JXA03_00245 [Bacteroidales bacterium]|nr:hypothetical protein [Bacteroidales bacterium]
MKPKASKKGPGVPGRFTVHTVALILLGLLVIIFALRMLSDADLGFHLNGGRWIVENGAFPSKDTYTYTVSDNGYINLHWLFQVSLHAVRAVAGYEGLSIYKAFLAFLVFLIVYFRMRVSGVNPVVMILLLFISVVCIQSRMLMRPEMFTYIYLGLMLLILGLYAEKQRDYLFFIPVIMLLWVNSHGLFILGWLMLGAYAAGKYMKERKPDRRLWLFSGLGVAVSLINPYFMKGVLFPFYLFTRFGSDSVFSNIIEFSPVFAAKDNLSLDFLLFYLLLALYVIFFLAGIKRRKLHEYLIGLMFIYLSMTAIRNIPLFVLAVLPFTAQYMSEALDRISGKRGIRIRVVSAPFISMAVILLVLTTFLRLLTNAWYTDKRLKFRTGLGLDVLEQPVRATDFINRSNIKGRILNDLNSGGWLAWATRQPVFIDGRLEVMKEDFYREYLTMQQEGGLDAMIRKYKPDVIFFDYESNVAWIMHLSAGKTWKLVWVDEVAAVYVRADRYPEIPEFDLNLLLKDKNLEVFSEAVAWEILQAPRKRAFAHWLGGFVHPSEYLYPAYLKPGTFADIAGNSAVAETLYLEFARRDGKRYYNVFSNMGLLYLKTEDYRKAAFCWRYVLDRDPGNKLARRNLNYTGSMIKQ